MVNNLQIWIKLSVHINQYNMHNNDFETSFTVIEVAQNAQYLERKRGLKTITIIDE